MKVESKKWIGKNVADYFEAIVHKRFILFTFGQDALLNKGVFCALIFEKFVVAALWKQEKTKVSRVGIALERACWKELTLSFSVKFY